GGGGAGWAGAGASAGPPWGGRAVGGAPAARVSPARGEPGGGGGGGGGGRPPRHAVPADPASVLPLIGSKEFIASLPAVLGCGPGDTVVYPELAYPTYAVGALLAGATAVAADRLSAVGPGRVAPVWVHSPAHPPGPAP